MSIVRVGRGTIYISMLNFTQFAAGLLYYSVLARLLTRTDIGILSVLTFVVSVYSVFATLSLPVAAAKYISEYVGQNDRGRAASVAAKVLRLVFVSSALSFIPVILIPMLFVGQSFVILLLAVYCFGAFLGITKMVYLSFLQGLQMFGKYSIVASLAIVLTRSVGVMLVMLNYGLLGAVTGAVVGEAVSLLLAVFLFRGSLPDKRASYDSKLLLNFSIPLFVVSLVAVVSDWADRTLFLAITGNLDYLGIYDLVVRGSSILMMIPTTMSTTLLPAFSEMFGQSSDSGLHEPLTRTSRYLAYLIFPAAFGLTAVSKTAMALLYGWEYSIGSLPLSILAAFSVFPAFTSIMGSVLQSVGETRVFVRIVTAQVLVNLAFSLSLIPVLGIYGSATARAATMVIGFAYSYYALRGRMRVEFDKAAIRKAILASTMMVIPIAFFDSLYSGVILTNPAVSIVVELSLGMLIYGFVLLLLKAFSSEDFEILRKVAPASLTKVIDRMEVIFVR